MFSKSLIQFSVDGWGCVPSLLLDLRPNYGGGNEDNGDLLQKVPCTHCYTQCPQPCSRPLPTHASAGDSWTLLGKSGSVSCGVTTPFSCVLVHTRFCLCLRVCFPVLCNFWRVSGGKWRPLPRGLMPHPGLLHPEPLPLQQATADTPPQVNTVLSQSLWGLWVLVHTKFV